MQTSERTPKTGFRRRRDGESEGAYEKAFDRHMYKLHKIKLRKNADTMIHPVFTRNHDAGEVYEFSREEVAKYQAVVDAGGSWEEKNAVRGSV